MAPTKKEIVHEDSTAFIDEKMLNYELPEEPTATDHLVHPIKSCQSFFAKLVNDFGIRFVVMMGVMYFIVKGVLHSLLGLIKLSYCKKSLKIDGTQCQTLGVIASTPWAMKGIVGVLSDSYPLLGYHKSSYIAIAAVIGTLASLILSVATIPSAVVAGLLLMALNLEVATSDLLCEGKYSAMMKIRPQSGSSMVTFVWGCIMAGSFVAACFVGPVADKYDPKILFFFCIPMAASILVPTFLGYLREDKVEHADRAINFEQMREHWKPTLLCVLMALLAMGNAIVDTIFFDNELLQLLFCCVGSAILAVLCYLWLPKDMANCNLYMFLSGVLYITISGPLDFWFTAEGSCVPGGPAFDYTYYNTYTAMVGSVMAWVGVVLFESALSGWTFRQVFWITTLLQVIASVSDVIIVMRWNLAWGISDRAFYMLGDAVLGPVVSTIAFMPSVVLISKLASKGIESTTFALLAGFSNFGNNVSSQIGIYVTRAAGISTVEPCNFDNLIPVLVVGHCLLPLLAIPLTFLLIPDKLMTESLDPPDDDEVAAAGGAGAGEDGAGAGGEGGAEGRAGYKTL